MNHLLLLRHAKAVPATAPMADFNRPLAERGLQDARRIGERLHLAPRPTAILSSPATRALQTAEIVAAALGYARDQIALEPRLYLADPATLLAVVAAQDAACSTLLVTGHNPGVTDLAHRLLPTFAVDDLPTCAVVGLEYASLVEWADAPRSKPQLCYYDFPKNDGSPLTAR